MRNNPRDFWRRLQTGVEVTVASSSPDRLLGVRDAFRRYFQGALGWTASIVVVPQASEDSAGGLPVSERETLCGVRAQARQLMTELPDLYHFYVALRAGLCPADVEGEQHFFLRTWSYVASPLGEAWGSSGSIELPDRFVAALGGEAELASVPGTRRQGGMTSALTGGSSSRRETVAVSTFHALSTLCYGVLHSPPEVAP